MAKRLLFITPMFPQNPSEDFMVPFVSHFTEEFSCQTDVEIEVISLMFPKAKPYHYGKVKVHPVGSGYRKSILIVPFLMMAIGKGIRLHKKNNYDGILCFWYRENAFIGKFLSRILGLKLRVWMLGQDVKKNNKYIPLLQLPSSEIIMLSEHQRRIFEQNFQQIVPIIARVAVDVKKFPNLNSQARNITILGVGNLSKLKNYALFLDIVFELKKFHPLIKTVICGGDAGEQKNLEAQIKALKLSENIILTGNIAHREVLNYMNNALIFLHTATFEGGPLVIQEALYSGCQVVSTIPMENGALANRFFHSQEKAALIQKILSILNEPQEAQRIEHFKMKDTVKTIYEAFYPISF